MRNKIFYYIFFSLLLLYFWQLGIYWLSYSQKIEGKGSLLQSALLGFSMLTGGFIIFLEKKRIPHKLPFRIAFTWLFMMLVVGLYNPTPPSFLLASMLWPMVFLVSYLYSLLHPHPEKFLVNYFRLLALMGLFLLAYSLLFVNLEDGSNLIYFFILPMPLLLIDSKQKRSRMYLLFIIMIIAVLLSSKRSMILAFALFFITWFMNNSIKKKHFFQSILVIAILVGGIVYAFNHFSILSEGALAQKVEMDDVTNGREGIYIITWEMFDNSDILHKILGHGHSAVKSDSPLDISAHNEWLEILYDYGIIAVILYLLLWIFMLRKWYQLFKQESEFFISYSLFICIWSVMSMVSQLVLYASYVNYLFMFLAFVEAKTSNNKSIYVCG